MTEPKKELRRYHLEETPRMRDLQGAPLASFRSRALALLVDFLMAAALFVAFAWPLDLVSHKFGREVHITFTFFGNWYSSAFLVLYFGLSTYWGNGRTPGKRLMRIRVVSLLHEHITLWHSVERALGYGASLLEAGSGFFQYYVHSNRRTVHDRIADTIVIQESKVVS